MKILIGADLVPTLPNYNDFANGNIENIIDEHLISKLQEADYRIFNLETPLVDKQTPIEKNGPNLFAPTSTINGIKKLGVDFFTCANNHILDQGEDGLKSTVKVLNDNKINFAGIGSNIEDAKTPFVFEINGKKIGVYCCAEHEFSIATNITSGANPFDPICSFANIKELKDVVDYIIVLYHGGKEHYRYPSPRLQETCHKFADNGANLIICQHSHCIGCEEKYKESTIVYGQGNFIFDLENNEYWNTSLLVELNINNNNYDINYVPLEKNGNKVMLSNNSKIINDFNLRSNQIKNKEFIKQNYFNFAKSMADNYLLAFYGHRTIIDKILNKVTFGKYYKHLLKKKYRKNEMLAIYNYINCEAHKELLDVILKNGEVE